jgi:hypothetical protein
MNFTQVFGDMFCLQVFPDQERLRYGHNECKTIENEWHVGLLFDWQPSRPPEVLRRSRMDYYMIELVTRYKRIIRIVITARVSVI